MSKLLSLRTQAKVSAEQIVRDLGTQGINISRETIYRAEKGESITLKTARILAAYFNVGIEDVVDVPVK